MAPFPSDKRGSGAEGAHSLAGGWRLVEGEGAGTGGSEAHQSPLVPASVLEADAVPPLPPARSQPRHWRQAARRRFPSHPRPKASSWLL